jgi:hypothetical protein
MFGAPASSPLSPLIEWLAPSRPRPGRPQPKPPDQLDLFVDRDNERPLFHRYLNSATEPPVLMFYGIGGAGKSWRPKKPIAKTM